MLKSPCAMVTWRHGGMLTWRHGPTSPTPYGNILGHMGFPPSNCPDTSCKPIGMNHGTMVTW
eukprot:3982277-Karenia_brevis.AAC.1